MYSGVNSVLQENVQKAWPCSLNVVKALRSRPAESGRAKRSKHVDVEGREPEAQGYKKGDIFAFQARQLFHILLF